MSSHDQTVISKHEPVAGSLASYVCGFLLSVTFTLTAFAIVEVHLHASNHAASNNPLIATIIGLAIIQFFIQLYFFLHLGKEMRPRWKLLVFTFMVGVVLILVIGSLWIMANLNYRMTPDEINNYLHSQDSL